LAHIRAAALVAALVPLASVVATPASAQTTCPSGGICGTVFNDVNHNGIQDAGEGGLVNVTVNIIDTASNTVIGSVQTDTNGFFALPVTGGEQVTVEAVPPSLFQLSPVPASCPGVCNSGTLSLTGTSVAPPVVVSGLGTAVSFGFFQSAASNPGTGTPGFWKNHPDAWPVQTINIGGVDYSETTAIFWLGNLGKDKTTTMFAQLVSAKLNLMIGNDGSCVSSTIAAADLWMANYGPVGQNVSGSSAAWGAGQPLAQTLDAYNNGLLCAPHRK
jgi:hypothetical protein